MEANPTLSPGDLPAQWRQRAQFLSDYGDPVSARLWQIAAAELEQALRALGEESLTLVEAAQLCGYTPEHIGSLVRQGKIANLGRKNAPRVRRADLPTKQPTKPGRPPKKDKAAAEAEQITSIASKLR